MRLYLQLRNLHRRFIDLSISQNFTKSLNWKQFEDFGGKYAGRVGKNKRGLLAVFHSCRAAAQLQCSSDIDKRRLEKMVEEAGKFISPFTACERSDVDFS